MTTTTRGRTAPKGSVNLSDLRYSVTQTRTRFTRVRGFKRGGKPNRQPKADFITFLSLACEMYRDHGDELVPVQQYSPELETFQGKGHTSLVTHFEVSQLTPSNYLRGSTTTYSEAIVIKRLHNSRLDEKSDGLISFITELRVRNHAPLRSNPHIAKLRGIGWDFEDQEGTIPRPILLEELAPQGAMDNLWKNWNFVRMTFKSRLEFCRDIADGLHALHLCGVVHGDVKPENILVFPREDKRDAFMVKLTDFGHSVLEQDGLEGLPAFTPLWCAPEATQKASMTFQDMEATDCYSYGLVVLSIMLGRAFYNALKEVEAIKVDGSILERSIALIEREDKESNDSDLEVDVVRALLRKTLRLDPSSRNLKHCMSIIDRYERRNDAASVRKRVRISDKKTPLPHLDIAGKVDIGYQTLMRCSHPFKTYIVEKLLTIANDTADRRRAAAAWELTVCYFSGFGVSQSFEECSRWLTVAAANGSVPAQDYFNIIHEAMGIDPSSISRSTSDINSTWSSTTAVDWEPSRTLPATSELPLSAVSDDPGSSGPDSYFSESDDDQGEQTVPTVMPGHIAKLITSGSVDELRQLLQDDPSLLNSQDPAGNTPLLLAVKSKRTDMVELILESSSVDAGICNHAGQGVLHHLPGFSDDQIRRLVPLLVDRKADLNAECLSTHRNGSSAGIAAGIRSCSLLNSILHKNMTLLRCLLDAAHSDKCVSACRVCEAGSAFRRMLAMSLSFFQADALAILVAHIRAHRGEQVLELDKIEVWAGQGLLPLHQVPFHSVAVAEMDYPESFFRALLYGGDYLSSLRRTIEFLMDAAKELRAVSYSMLSAAVARNSIDGARILLKDGGPRHLPKLWWAQQFNMKDFVNLYGLPIMSSISRGSREIFETFLEQDKSPFTEEVIQNCSDPDCGFPLPPWKAELYYFLGISTRARPARRPGPHTHRFNLVATALDVAFLAKHQDLYFSDTLLSVLNPDMVNDRWAPELLARAILKSSFIAAKRFADCFPWLWTSSTAIDVVSRIPSEFRHRAHEDSFDIRYGTVVDWIMYDGSYEQCQFVLKALRTLREPSSKPGAGKRWLRYRREKQDTADGTLPQWQQGLLEKKEYHALLSGNIRRARDDREPLWSIIAQEIANGHSTSTFYLVAAIKHYNAEALSKMLEIGWKPDSKFSPFSTSPLRVVTSLLEHAKTHRGEAPISQSLFDMLQRNSGPFMTGSSRDYTHSYVYSRYWETQHQLVAQFRIKTLQEMADILVSHGARIVRTPVVSDMQAALLGIALYALFYAACLPLLLVYTTEDAWTTMTRSQKFGFVYLWAVIAVLFPYLLLVIDGPPHRFSGYGRNIWYVVCAVFYLFNHIALPVLVIHHNWQPFRNCRQMGQCRLECTNYTFLLPLVVGAVEYVLGTVIFKYGDRADWW